jgi:hypothetical protein
VPCAKLSLDVVVFPPNTPSLLLLEAIGRIPEIIEDACDCGSSGSSSAKLNFGLDVELPESCHAASRGGAVTLASPVAASVLVRSDAAALSACKLVSDLPNCSRLPARFVPDRLDDV